MVWFLGKCDLPFHRVGVAAYMAARRAARRIRQHYHDDSENHSLLSEAGHCGIAAVMLGARTHIVRCGNAAAAKADCRGRFRCTSAQAPQAEFQGPQRDVAVVPCVDGSELARRIFT